jgi:ABC-type transport system substrate-binding protein
LDNGTEITGHDLAFSLKLNFVPEAETRHIKPYLDCIEDVIVDAKNPKKITIICKRPYMSAETSIAANQYFLPQYIYDPENLLDNYTVKDLLSDDYEIQKILEDDENLIAFAKFFNGQDFKRKTTSGSGPYEFVNWDTNQKLELKRKKKWWGYKVKKRIRMLGLKHILNI